VTATSEYSIHILKYKFLNTIFGFFLIFLTIAIKSKRNQKHSINGQVTLQKGLTIYDLYIAKASQSLFSKKEERLPTFPPCQEKVMRQHVLPFFGHFRNEKP